MLPHYIRDHGFAPAANFVNDVLNTEFTGGNRVQTRGQNAEPERVGYLSGAYEMGQVPAGFLEKLQRVMELAANRGARVQTKGFGEKVMRGEERSRGIAHSLDKIAALRLRPIGGLRRIRPALVPQRLIRRRLRSASIPTLHNIGARC